MIGNIDSGLPGEEPGYFTFLRRVTNNKLKPKQLLTMQTYFETACFALGESNPYYHYFLAKEDEKKENLLLLHENIKSQRLIYATGCFVSYNIVKSLLWRYGYFAHFFYHTRMMGFVVYISTIYLINKNFEAHLISNGLIRYHEKRQAYKITEERIRNLILKEEVMGMKKNF